MTVCDSINSVEDIKAWEILEGTTRQKGMKLASCGEMLTAVCEQPTLSREEIEAVKETV